MSYTEVPLLACRVPRIQRGVAHFAARDVYALFGFTCHFLSKTGNGDVYTMVAAPDEPGDEVSWDFDRLMAAGAETDTAGLPIDRLTPMEFVAVPGEHTGVICEEALYAALGIKYSIVSRYIGTQQTNQYIVLASYEESVMKMIAESSDIRARIGGVASTKDPKNPYAVRIKNDSIPAPKTVKFADVYELRPVHMEQLAIMFGAKYVKYGVYSGGKGQKFVYVLDGLGATVEERMEKYEALKADDQAASRELETELPMKRPVRVAEGRAPPANVPVPKAPPAKRAVVEAKEKTPAAKLKPYAENLALLEQMMGPGHVHQVLEAALTAVAGREDSSDEE